MIKSYNIFVDSVRGTTLNLHEQAPSGGVVRVSLKSLYVKGLIDLDVHILLVRLVTRVTTRHTGRPAAKSKYVRRT
eukprot:scaffold29666_cov106-Isochrysis_galbana.AAC.4